MVQQLWLCLSTTLVWYQANKSLSLTKARLAQGQGLQRNWTSLAVAPEQLTNAARP
jgi:hypothetical protein